MEWIWNAVVALLALAGTTVNIIVVWWKVSSQNMLMGVNLGKLTEIVDKLDNKISSHMSDTGLHRTHDFESRLDAFMLSVKEFTEQNRQDHESIIQLIRETAVGKK